MATVIGTVTKVVGMAIVVDEQGNRHMLKEGEALHAGDKVVTASGATVVVKLANGETVNFAEAQTVKITENLAQADVSDVTENAVNQAIFDAVLTALNEGRDVTDVLDDPAAGAPGSDGNASFVNLDRIQTADANASNFNGGLGSGGGAIVGGGIPANYVYFTPAGSAPSVLLDTDANNNGYITKAELNGATAVSARIGLPVGVEPGDALNITDNNGSRVIVITSADITAGGITVLVSPLPADGATVTVTASITNQSGQTSPASSDSAILDLSPPDQPQLGVDFYGYDDVAPVVGTIANNSTINDTKPELIGTSKEADGSVVTIYDNGLEIGTATITGGKWTYETPEFKDGTKHALSVTVTDLAGNVSSMSDALDFTVDTSNPDTPKLGVDFYGYDDIAPIVGTIVDNSTTNDTKPQLIGTSKEPDGSVVTIYDNSLEVGTATITGGKWTYETPEFKDGTKHALSVTVTDLAGNVSSMSDALDFTVDTSNPDTPKLGVDFYGYDDIAPIVGTIVDNSTTNDTKPQLIGTSKEPDGSVVTIYDNGLNIGTAKITGGKWIYETPEFADGTKHAITVTVTDLAGNVSGMSDALDFTIDKTAPDKPVITGAFDDEAPLTGNVSNGGFTDDTTPKLSGKAEANSLVEVFDGAKSLGTTKADANGDWVLQIKEPLLNGTRELTAVATDAAGNSSVPSDKYVINVDTNAPQDPSIVRIDDNVGSIQGPIQKSSTTDDTTPTVVGTAGANLKINVYDNGVLLGSTTSDAKGDWTFTPSPALAEGNHNVTATAVSAAGIESGKTGGFAFVVDTTAPTVNVNQLTDDVAPKVGSINNGDTTDDNTPTVSGTGEPGATVTVRDNGQPVGTTTVQPNGTWTFTPTTPLVDGPHSITVTSTDAAGNTSAPTAPTNFIVDTKAVDVPTITSITDDFAPITGTVTKDGDTNDTTPTVNGTAPAGAVSVEVFVNGTSQGTVAVTNGTWTFTPTTALGDGHYDFTATAINAAGKVSAPTAAYGINVDTKAPVVPTIEDVQDDVGSKQGTVVNNGVTDDTTPTVSGKGEAGSTITLFDGAATLGTAVVKADGTWSYTPTTTLTDGKHAFTVTSTDKAGNVSPTSTTYTVTVDTSAPNKPSIDSVFDDVGTVTGNIANGGFTDDAKPAISGKGEPGALITVYDGKTAIGTTTVKADGSWSLEPSSPLLNGTRELTAVATDAAGNSSVPSDKYVINVDTNAPQDPSIVRIDDNVGSIQGPIQKSSTTDDTTPTVVGTAGANLKINVYDNGVLIGSTTSDAKGDWTFTPSPALAEGNHNVTATAVSAAGIESGKTGGFAFIVDTTAPTVNVNQITDDVAPKVGSINNGDTTDDNTPTVSGTGEPGATVTVRDNGQPVGTTTVQPNGTWTFTPTTPLVDGPHSITVTSTDAAGNTSAPTAPTNFTVDTKAVDVPTITSITDDFAPITGTVTKDGDTNDTTPTVNGTAPTGAVSVEVFVNGTSQGTVAVTNGTWTFTPTTALGDGHYDFTATAINAAGKVSAPTAAYGINVDTKAPVVPTIEDVQDDVGSKQGTVVNNGVTDDTTPTVSGKGEAGSTITLFDGAATLGTAVVKADGTWSYTPTTTLTDGKHAFTVTSTDKAGNVSPTSTTYTVTVDTSAPNKPSIDNIIDDVGTVTGNIANGGFTDDAKPAISGKGEPGALITVYDGKTAIGTTTVKADGSWSLEPSSPLLNGTRELTAVATDAAGNSSVPSDKYVINVDTNAPQDPSIVRIDDNVGVVQGPIQKSSTTDDTTPTVVGTAGANLKINVYDNGVLIGSTTSDAKGDWTFTPSPALAEGNHNVTATAVSAAGIESGKTGGFAFVVDTTAPTVNVNQITDDVAPKVGSINNGDTTDDNTPTVSGTGEPGATVTVRDNGQPVGTTTVQQNGTWTFTPTTPLVDGPHSITVTSTDAAGNTSAPTAPTNFTVDTKAVDVPTITSITDNVDPITGTVTKDGDTNDTTPTVNGTAPAGAVSVEVFVNGTSQGTVAVTNGTWTFTPTTALGDGHYDFTATAINAAGKVSAPTAAYGINVDTKAPVVPTIEDVQDDVGSKQGTVVNNGVTDDTTPTVSGKGEAGSTITLFDGAATLGTAVVKADGTWSYTPTTTLTDGKHAFTVTSTDKAGNVSPTSTTYTVTVDTSAPNKPSIDNIIDDVGTVTGNIANGGFTDDAKPAISGKGEPGALITVYDGKTAIGTTTVKADGSWSLEPSSPLLNGTRELTAVATDAAGNSSVPSDKYVINVDTNAPQDPSIVRIDDNVGVVQGPIQKSSTTDDTTPTVVGTAGANLKINVYDNGVLIGSTTSDAKGDWTFTPSPALAEGNHNVTATAVSAAGIESGKTGGFAFVVDTTAPTVNVNQITDDVAPKVGSINNGDTTDDNTPTVSGTGEPGATVTVRDNGQPVGTTTVQQNGTWTFTPTTPLVDGPHSITVTSTDAAGNTSAPTAPTNFTVDTKAVDVPTITSITDNVDPITGTVTKDGDTNDTTPTVNGTAPAGAVSVEVFVNGTSQGTVAVTNGTWTFTPTTALGDGHYDFTATAINAAGKVSAPTAAYGINVDTKAPVVPTIEDVQDDVGSKQGTVVNNGVTDDTTPTVSGKGEAGSTITLFDGAATLGTAVVKADGTWSYTPTTTLTDGKHAFTVTSTDKAGNVSPTSTTYTVTVDTSAPNKPSIDNIIDDFGPSTGNVSNGGTSDDATPTLIGKAEANSVVTVFDGTTKIGTTTADANGNWTYTPATNISTGKHDYKVTATDAAGNTSGLSDSYTYSLNQSPVFTTLNGTVEVSEDGLPGGLIDAGPSNIIASGSLGISDPNGDLQSVTLTAPTTNYTSGGVAITWTGNNTGTLIGSANGKEVIRVTIEQDGDYAVRLSGPIDHPAAGEDTLALKFGVNAKDTDTTTTGSITVNVSDDAPTATNQTVTAAGASGTNIMLTLDVSGSMATRDGVNGTSRLESEIASINVLLDQYSALGGDVRVMIVTFSDAYYQKTATWVTIDEAKQVLSTLQTLSGTNYDAALDGSKTAFNSAGKITGAQNVGYFFSDGEPNSGREIGTTDKANWETFLKDNDINQYAIGVGSGVSATQVGNSMNQIAYNGATEVDTNAIAVSNFNQLNSVLSATVATPVTGSLTAGGGFGADGGFVKSFTVEGSTYTYDAKTGALTVTGTNNSTYNATTHEVTVKTADGTFVVDMDNGSYSFQAKSATTFVGATVIADSVEMQQNDNTTLESAPVMTALEDGRFMAVWYKNALSDEDKSMTVWGRIFNADGTPSTNEFQVGTLAVDGSDGYDVPNVTISQLEGGNVVVQWVRSAGNVHSQDTPVFTIVNPGVAGSNPTTVIQDVVMRDPSNTGVDSPAVVEALADGRFIAVWADNGLSDNTTSMKLQARIFNADGSASTGQFQIGTWAVDGTDSYDVANWSVTQLANGNIVIGYVRNYAEAGGDEPVFTIISSNGSTIVQNVEMQQNDTTTWESPPVIEALADGRFIAIWNKDGLSDDTKSMTVQARIFNADGTPSTSEFRIGSQSVDGFDGYDIDNMTVKQLANGNIVVGFVRNTAENGNDAPIFTLLDKNGNTLLADVSIEQTESNSRYDSPPLIEALADGRFIAVWVLNGINDDITSMKIMARVFNADGTPSTNEFQVGSAAVDGTDSYDVPNLTVTQLANGNVVVGWQRNYAENGDDEPVYSVIKIDPIPTNGTGSTTISYTLSDNDGDTSNGSLTVNVQNTYSYTPTPAVAPDVGNAVGAAGLLTLPGLLNVDLLNFSSRQAFTASDVNNNINAVTISYSTLLGITLGSAYMTYSQAVANELGLSVNYSQNGGFLGLLGASGKMVITAADGGTVDNLALNEFLSTVRVNEQLVDVSLLQSFTITATDSTNLQDTATSANLINIDLLSSGRNSNVITGGDAGDNVLTGTSGNDIIYGYAGNDTLNGGAGNDILRGGAGNDTLNGGDGNDILIGGKGNDTLTGGAGVDVFKWDSGDEGVAGNPARDTITDFNKATVAQGGDVLDIRDLLQGENPNNLQNYMHFEKSGSDTIVHISSNGGFANDAHNVSGSFSSGSTTQQIVLSGVDLTSGQSSDAAIINNLLSQQKLVVDQ